MAPCKVLHIPQALALALDSERRHRQKVPRRDLDPFAHAGIRDALEEADQFEIGCGGGDFGHGRRMTAAVELDIASTARAHVTYFE